MKIIAIATSVLLLFLIQACESTSSYRCPDGYTQGDARIGMTKQEVLCSGRGKADRIIRTDTVMGSLETWVYGHSVFVFFDVNGKVYQIHNTLSR